MRPRLLSRLVPGLDAFVRPLDLVTRPTPITEAPALARVWGQSSLWIKRDDLTNPIYGGSKVRNLEFFLGQARVQGATGVITMGPYGSHQVLATAVFGHLAGFRTRAVLTPQPDVAEIALNRRLLPQLDMDILQCGSFAGVPFAILKGRLSELGGRKPYWIPPGSNHPLGVMGVLEGALEVAEAIKSGEIPMPDDVVVPTGTCATAAGIYLGFALADLPVRVVAVRMVPMIITGPRKMRRMAEKTDAILRGHGLTAPARWGEVLWIDDFAGPGYGLTNSRAEHAERDVAAHEGFRTETTYTAKTLALLATGGLRGRKVLFWNTFSALEPDPAYIMSASSSPDAATPSQTLERLSA